MSVDLTIDFTLTCEQDSLPVSNQPFSIMNNGLRLGGADSHPSSHYQTAAVHADGHGLMKPTEVHHLQRAERRF